MSYTGETLTISCNEGGLTGNRNTSLVDPHDMVNGTMNINIHEGVRTKRGGTSRITAEIESGAQIWGLFDYLKPAGTQYIVFATSGKIYKNATTTIKTGWTASQRVWFNQFDGELYAFNGSDDPGKWDGTTWTDLDTDIPTDWGTSKPKYAITHGRGNSLRQWAFGCGSTPYTIYVSPSGDGDDFSDANVTTLKVDTEDGYGIVGGVTYIDQLIVFGRKRSYVIDDSDTNTSNWGYVESPWKGGAAHQRLIIPTPNDIVVVDENLEIYSFTAAQEYGDYKVASISRPAFMHNWIRDNVREAYIAHFHGIYDPVLRAVKIFVVRNGETTIDTALVYFLDRGPKAGWMIHNNTNYASGYNASCSALIYVGAGDYQIYTGDYSGYIWGLENSTKSDNSNDFISKYLTGNLDLGNPRIKKHFRRGKLIVDPQGTETISVRVWIDDTEIDTATVWAKETSITVGYICKNDNIFYEATTAHTSSELEDFTNYTETDGPTKVTVAANTITLTSGDRDEDYYVTYDYTASHFDDFTHWVDVKVTSLTSDALSAFSCWGLADAIDDFKDIDDASGDCLFLWAVRHTSNTHYAISIRSVDGGTLTTVDTSAAIAVNSMAYLAIERDGTTLTVDIYSTAALRIAGAAGDIDTITGTVVGTDFRYLYALGSYNTGDTAKDISGTVSNLTITPYLEDEPGTGSNWEDYWTQHRFSMTVASGTKDYTYDIGAKGTRIKRAVINNIANEDYIIEEDLLDFKNLGAEPG